MLRFMGICCLIRRVILKYYDLLDMDCDVNLNMVNDVNILENIIVFA